ncbi:hypothetical protein F5Y07DRAFT_349137 [Xylaria sp. FL0933]|nr:hypothetical protein F5Y07DRAFT_349137 [Xylaria sp. FL0933]
MLEKEQLELLRRSLGREHVESFWPHFEHKASDLFVVESSDTRVGVLNYIATLNTVSDGKRKTHENLYYKLVTDSRTLAVEISKELPSGASRVLILHRYNSWSPLDITFEMFRAICDSDRVLACFIKIVTGFGTKLSSGDEDFMACYSQIDSQPEEKAGPIAASGARQEVCISTFCYNIRHMECHGRELDDPWSCRHSAIHQTIFHSSRKTRTIIIQPPETLGSTLTVDTSVNESHPMGLHLRLLAAGIAEWRDYLNYVAKKIQESDMCISISKPYGEFGLDLSSKQQVHSLRRKLFRSRSILSKIRATLMKIKMHEQRVAKLCKLPANMQQGFQNDLSNMSADVDNHLQTIRKLLSMSYDIKAMYTNIIHLSSQDLMHQNAMKLSQIAENDSRDNKIMVSISNKMYHDSRTMRIATVVAMLYLPANVVLSFFSTSFVWLDGEADPTLRVQHESWVAVVAIIILAASTFGAAWWWDCRGRGSSTQHLGQHMADG